MSNRNSGSSRKQTNRHVKVAPTARAIRSALAISAAMLALAGSGVAFAGTCTGTTEVHCNGDFVNTLPDFAPVVDMTLILGDTDPTTVTPPAGDEGVLANWAGVITVMSYADTTITTAGADGVYIAGNSNVVLDNQGGIDTYVTAASQYAAYVFGYDAVDVVNGGDIYAHAGFAYDVTAVHAYSFAAGVTLDNQLGGTVSATAYNGNATGIDANGSSASTVDNEGSVLAYTVGGNATGIYAYTYNGDLAVTNSGTVEADSSYGQATGIQAYGLVGSVTVTNSSEVSASGYGDATGIYAHALVGTAAVVNSGTVTATSDGYDATGIYSLSYAGDASIDNQAGGSVTATGVYHATGLSAYGYFETTVTNAGSVSATASGDNLGGYVEAFGVEAVSYAGNVTVGNSGSIDATASGYAFDANVAVGIYAVAANGSVSVSNDGGTVTVLDDGTGYYGAFATGIVAGAYYDATVDSSGTVSATSTYGDAVGVSAIAVNGIVTVTNSGSIGADGYSSATGVYAAGLAFGTGGIVVDNSSTGVIDATSANIAQGVYAYSYLDAGISVTNAGSISADGDVGAVGIHSYAFIGDTNISNAAGGSIDAYSYDGVAFGIYAYDYGLGSTSVSNAGSISADGWTGAIGIDAYSHFFGDIAITTASTSDIEVYGNIGAATGIYAYTYGGSIGVSNGGDLTVSSDGFDIGIDAFARNGYDVVVSNSGSIDAISYGSIAEGIRATARGEYATVDVSNSGTIHATSDYLIALGILADANNGVTVSNSATGAINVSGYYYGFGVDAETVYGDSLVANDGSINVYAGPSDFPFTSKAYGILTSSDYGNVTVDNGATGTITVEAGSYGSPGAYAVGVLASNPYGDGDTTVTNDGDIAVTARSGPGAFELAEAIGVNAGSHYTFGDVSVLGDGDLSVIAVGGDYSAYSAALATGITAASFYGAVTIDSNGTTDVSARTGYNTIYSNALAVGMHAESNNGDVTVSLGADGEINSTALVGTGDLSNDNQADAYGITTYSYYGDTFIHNDGAVNATANADGSYGYSHAFGISALVNPYGEGAITIDGSGDVTALAQDNATGILAQNYGYGDYGVIDVSVDGGDVLASAIGGYYTTASGAEIYGYHVSFASTGSVAAVSTGDYIAYAYGVHITTYPQFGDVVVDGGGDISAVASSAFYSLASGLYVNTGTATVGSDGIVTATASTTADNGYSYAYGVSVLSYYDTTVTTDGAINATANSPYVGYAVGLGVYSYGDIDIDNGADITVARSGNYGHGYGLVAAAPGDITVASSGAISVTSDGLYGVAAGLEVFSFNGDVSIVSDGSISALGDYYSVGLYSNSYYDAYVRSNAAVTASATGSYTTTANGIVINAYSVEAISNGAVSATSSGDYIAYAGGITIATDLYGGDVNLTSTGAVTATAASAFYSEAYGINVSTGSATVSSTGNVTATATTTADNGYSYAYGVSVFGKYDATVTTGGSIHATATSPYLGYATGLSVYSGGDIDITNGAAITVLRTGNYGQGTGMQVNGIGDIAIASTGAISVTSDGLYGVAAGIQVYGSGDLSLVSSGSVSAVGDYYSVGVFASVDGDAYVRSNAPVTASAIGGDAGPYTTANGIVIYATNVEAISNGAVSATSSSDYISYANGILIEGDTNGGDLSLTSTGAVSASASSGFYSWAAGIYVTGGNTTVSSTGNITATATTTADNGYSYAYGVSAFGKYDADVSTDGAIVATATSPYTANAYGVQVLGFGTIEIDNAADITVSGSGTYGSAIGLQGAGVDDIAAHNSGAISASFDGEFGVATGVDLLSVDGDITFTNDGNISASGDYYSTGVYMGSAGYTTLDNNGTISATGGTYDVAVWTEDSSDIIRNFGVMNGALWTGAGDDFVFNGQAANHAHAVWNPGSQTATYLGTGDDVIVNWGTINMVDSTIDLGANSDVGNGFYNDGTITVDGTGNYINMGGGGETLIPSANPNPFTNYGVIDFQDGAADDYLLITGDFAGDGDINVDVSGLDGTADQLYIDGSVVTGTVNTINVNLLDLDETGTFDSIPIVYVSGNSVDGNFVLGDVEWDDANSFVTLDFSIVADINSPPNPDVFSLGMEVTGLTDAGSLATTLSPAVSSLMSTQVGTWRQRMGVIDGFSKGAVALWARVFGDKGSFSPEHSSNFGSGGNFDWEQHNSGVEAGVDFSVTDEFSLGLLVSKSQADVDLDQGNGSADLDADTWGIYGTWISPNGFYLDLSYRWMSFDVDLGSTSIGAMSSDGHAEAVNVEAGYAWTLAGGLKIEPQIQYTKVSVDSGDIAFTTSTGMTFVSDGGDSSRGRVGVALRKSFGDADSGWLWTPYVTLSAVREFDGDHGYAINNAFVGVTSTEGTSGLLELGFTARHENWAVYGGLNWQDGGAVNSFFGGQLGVRYTFGGPAPAPVVVAPPPAKTCADLDDDGDGVNNCDDHCPGSPAGEAVGADGCPVPAPEPVVEPKPYRN